MGDQLGVPGGLDAFSQAIASVHQLRSSVSRLFSSLKDGMRSRETLEEREKEFALEFQENLNGVNRDLNDLDRLCNLVGRPSESHPLHNSGLLSLDPVQDKTPIYSQLLQAHKWSNKVMAHRGSASVIVVEISPSRQQISLTVEAERRMQVLFYNLAITPEYVDEVITRMDRLFGDMSFTLSRPSGTSAIVVISLGKVLRALVVMRSLILERVVVKALHENIQTEDGKLDLWSKSRYLVFQKVTDHATAASLHYQLPHLPEVVIRSFMMWMHSYISLFQSTCQRCGKQLQDGLPPTWRDFRTLEAFHDTCRQ
uniref:Mediator complex subunit 27 n=1 Tax=Petromyzon marinus TaxID=7757 RepID=S4R5N0_PETMA